MANKCFMVLVSDYFQFYIPLYVYALRTWSKDDILIYATGEIDSRIKESVKGQCQIFDNIAVGYPNLTSTAASLRFTMAGKALLSYEYVMITDADVMLFMDPWQQHIERICQKTPIGCHHGAWSKPRRPEICPTWSGSFERIAGGMCCVTPDWYRRTIVARKNYDNLLKVGVEGTYRENDEVILCRIAKESGIHVPIDKWFPRDFIGIHFGDFKPSMAHRYLNKKKMAKMVSERIFNIYLYCRKDPLFRIMLKVSRLNDSVRETVNNLEDYVENRVQ